MQPGGYFCGQVLLRHCRRRRIEDRRTGWPATSKNCRVAGRCATSSRRGVGERRCGEEHRGRGRSARHCGVGVTRWRFWTQTSTDRRRRTWPIWDRSRWYPERRGWRFPGARTVSVSSRWGAWFRRARRSPSTAWPRAIPTSGAPRGSSPFSVNCSARSPGAGWTTCWSICRPAPSGRSSTPNSWEAKPHLFWSRLRRS